MHINPITMKNITLLTLGLFAMASCNNPQRNAPENTGELTESVGGERDQHGCLASTGETWSEIKQGCVQIFDIGQRLNPVETGDGEAVISAFVLFNDDKSKLELFLPNESETIILDKADGETYQHDSFRFDASTSALYVDDAKQYEASAD